MLRFLSWRGLHGGNCNRWLRDASGSRLRSTMTLLLAARCSLLVLVLVLVLVAGGSCW